MKLKIAATTSVAARCNSSILRRGKKERKGKRKRKGKLTEYIPVAATDFHRIKMSKVKKVL